MKKKTPNPMSVYVRAHPHCCGARDVEGLNNAYFTAARMMRGIIEHPNSHYWRFHNDDVRYAGTGFFNLCVATRGQDEPARRPLKRMDMFRKYVKRYKLGVVIVGPETGNPNYKGIHSLIPAIFIPDNEAMVRFGMERGYIAKRELRNDKGVDGFNFVNFAGSCAHAANPARYQRLV